MEYAITASNRDGPRALAKSPACRFVPSAADVASASVAGYLKPSIEPPAERGSRACHRPAST